MEELLRIARGSPLTMLIERHLPREGCLFEAGCGLGQYVLLFRERGRAAVGADWSLEALRAGARAGAPVALMDLRALAVRSGAIRTYLSLGVVEHDPAGPDAILNEAARVLPPGGVLLLSVPYWNGVRRLAAPYLRRQARAAEAAGGQFYQYAFTRRELRALVESAGFTVQGFHPYDPARILRKALGRTRGRGPAGGRDGPTRGAAGGRRGVFRRAARALVYAAPALRLLGHMLLAVAVRR